MRTSTIAFACTLILASALGCTIKDTETDPCSALDAHLSALVRADLEADENLKRHPELLQKLTAQIDVTASGSTTERCRTDPVYAACVLRAATAEQSSLCN